MVKYRGTTYFLLGMMGQSGGALKGRSHMMGTLSGNCNRVMAASLYLSHKLNSSLKGLDKYIIINTCEHVFIYIC
jgi:hypothetical protein